MHHTKEQWLAFFAEQAQSDLNQTEFAKRQGTIPTYFSYRKRQLLAFQVDNGSACCLLWYIFDFYNIYELKNESSNSCWWVRNPFE